MAPLVPDIIGNELNLIVALFIGIAFGFILEQAGFSTSKKLVGLFYGYDFTVLRVFFTAGVTAMIGIIAFGHFGLLDLNLIYVNPTFIWSAVIGGIIMGLGFVIGGFCPGTSVCAAAIGKIDAMIFIAGSFIGVFLFAEGYPLFEEFYKSGFWGYPHMFETLGMSQAAFAVLLTVAAVITFIATSLIEKRVNRSSKTSLQPVRLYYGIAGIAVILSFTAFLMPERKSDIIDRSTNNEIIIKFSPEKMTADEFAFRLIDADNKMQIIDLRSPEENKQMNFPNSVNPKIDDFFGKDGAGMFSGKNKRYVFIADDEGTEIQAAYIASELGYENIFVLADGLNGFKKNIINFQMPEMVDNRRDADVFRFREKASVLIPEIIKANKNRGVQEKKESKRVLGGC